jgi:hypothetical protein
MLWLILTVLALVAGLLAFRRKRSYESSEEEPWRRSLEPDDEPLDIDAIREAEEEWLESAEEEWDEGTPEDESWR